MNTNTMVNDGFLLLGFFGIGMVAILFMGLVFHVTGLFINTVFKMRYLNPFKVNEDTGDTYVAVGFLAWAVFSFVIVTATFLGFGILSLFKALTAA